MKCVKKMFDQFQALQSWGPDNAFISAMLKGHDAAYRPFVRAIEARNLPIFFDDLFALLLSEESRLQNH